MTSGGSNGGQSGLGVAFEQPPLSPETTALVIVDMTLGKCRPRPHNGERPDNAYYDRVETTVIPAARRLLEFFRTRGLRVLFVRSRGDDEQGRDWPAPYREDLLRSGALPCRPSMEAYDWLPELEPITGDLVFDKRSFSAFTSTGLETILNRLGVRHLVFAGVTTNYDVGHSAINAADRNFFSVLVGDGAAAHRQEDHDAFLALNSEYWFEGATAAEVIQRLSRQ